MNIVDPSNNICRILKKLEQEGNTEMIKAFAPLINWSEETERVVFERHKGKDKTRDVLYQDLKESTLIDLITHNMLKSDYGTDDIPFYYALRTGRFDFITAYYKAYISEKGDKLTHTYSLKDLQKAVEVCVTDAYEKKECLWSKNAFDAKNLTEVNAWFDQVKALGKMIEGHITEAESYYLHNAKSFFNYIKEQKAASQYLIGGKTVALENYHLEYAVSALDCKHLLADTQLHAQLKEIIEHKLENMTYQFFGRTHMSYQDETHFLSVVKDSVEDYEKFMQVATQAAEQKIISLTPEVEHSILESLSVQCPVVFLWAREIFPDHLYKGKYTHQQIENSYAASYQLHNSNTKIDYKDRAEIKKQLKADQDRYNQSHSLSEHYNVRREQFKRVGLDLPTVKDFKCTHIPDKANLVDLPGLDGIRNIDEVQRDKFNLERNIQKTDKKGLVLKV